MMKDICVHEASTSEGEGFYLEGTVATGFEGSALEEMQAKFRLCGQKGRGRIFFKVPRETLARALELRSLDKIFVVIFSKECAALGGDKEATLELIKSFLAESEIASGLAAWRAIRDTSGKYPNLVQQARQLVSSGEQGDTVETTANIVPSFRVTCNRTGTCHKFGSPDAASALGWQINETFGWRVDLKNFDLEFVLNVVDKKVWLSITLTKESLHRRNIVAFGATTLRSTIAHGLLRLCKIAPGDFVCDPMCGTGAIVVEAAICWPQAAYFAGDIYPVAVEKTRENFSALNLKADCLQWDATNLPLPDSSIDVVVTDLPFGKRMGSKFDNRGLYPALFKEWARVLKPQTGRLVVLSHDRKNVIQCEKRFQKFFVYKRSNGINLGGLDASVFLYGRSKLV